ncbi:Ribokinase-like protein [Amanita rubescens]|nr:Ribokinase-like protein [Amanita rubescens]
MTHSGTGSPPLFVTLGMFIIDEFLFMDEGGNATEKSIGGGGTYATIGARIWLPADQLGMIIDRGRDFPEDVYAALMNYGEQMWVFRDRDDGLTTRALNSYRGEHRGFQYLTPRVRITPGDLYETRLSRPRMLHFVCSPLRAAVIMTQVHEIGNWNPVTIYEPIPDRCIPSELPALTHVLPDISLFSPNAEEALSLLGKLFETAADRFLAYNIGRGSGWIIIRSGAMGAYIKNQKADGQWINAFWTPEDQDKIVDVTGAGNSFLGGLAAGLHLTGNIVEATLYASVSASFVIEQEGLPMLSAKLEGFWNNDSPHRRLEQMRRQMQPKTIG